MSTIKFFCSKCRKPGDPVESGDVEMNRVEVLSTLTQPQFKRYMTRKLIASHLREMVSKVDTPKIARDEADRQQRMMDRQIDVAARKRHIALAHSN